MVAADVLRPLDEVDTVPADTTVGELQDLCVRTGHSRFPVRRDDRLVGYVHVKDTLADDPSEPLREDRVRAMGVVPPGTPLDDVLAAMQKARAHLAVVEDSGSDSESGSKPSSESGPAGVLVLEDVLARLVGEVRGVTPPPHR